MNFVEFKEFRDQITPERSLIRLDCMNPFIAMNYLKSEFIGASSYGANDALDLWAQTMRMQAYRDIAMPTEGVRHSLKGLFNIFAANGKELWLPEDTYPYYWDTANDIGLKPHSFATLPTLDLSGIEKASHDSAILLTNPLSPLGCTLADHEVFKLKEWLERSKDRRVILDTVYSYKREFDQATLELFKTDQCFIAHSLSKAWLERGVFGALLAPEKEINLCKEVFSPPPVSASTSAFNALKMQNDLPDIQQKAFSEEWERLMPIIQEIDPNFKAPLTGYFAAISANHLDVLNEQNKLIIPASVFGSTKSDISIISCLYDMKP